MIARRYRAAVQSHTLVHVFENNCLSYILIYFFQSNFGCFAILIGFISNDNITPIMGGSDHSQHSSNQAAAEQPMSYDYYRN